MSKKQYNQTNFNGDSSMQIYLVGGAVRDTLLNLPIKDKDFMVVGGSVEQMLAQGFEQVGADFPVFLHPITHAEYALARTERKSGHGYQGFSVSTNNVSLEDDLMRRDLTINAMAMPVRSLFDDTLTGQIVDPYDGQDDLDKKVLRHVSPAFSEDPLRVLRVARFYARFYDMGFVVADETATLMQSIARDGELNHLSRERIWSESARALGEKRGYAYFKLLLELAILKHILPELSDSLQDKVRRESAFNALKRCPDAPLTIKFALLMSVFLDDPDALDKLQHTTNRLMTPNHIKNFAKAFITHYDNILKLPNVDADTLLSLIEQTRAHKDDETIRLLMQVVNALHKINISMEFMINAIKIYNKIGINDVNPNLKGKAIGDELTRLRKIQLADYLDQYLEDTARKHS